MRIVVALGGNALLRRGEPMTAENQRRNVSVAAKAIAPLSEDHQLVISHGNGPQVGLLALQGHAFRPEEAFPLDVLDAQTEGMIGYMIEQELTNLLPPGRLCATLLTRVEVDANDPAFHRPTKPIGPVYTEPEARAVSRERGWSVAPGERGFRRVVPSPRPTRINQLALIELLVERGVVVVCAGGGGIPIVRGPDGALQGVEAVIDKDLASGLLARELGAEAFLMLTDVDAVYEHLGGGGRAIRRASPDQIRQLDFATGSMGPKVEAAADFVEQAGGEAGIGRLQDATAILAGRAGTVIARDVDSMEWWGPA